MGNFLKQSGIFNGVTPSEKNPEYMTVRFTVPEVYKGNILPANALNSPNIVCTLNVTKKQKILDLLSKMTVGNSYLLSLDVDCEQPNGGYKAKIKYDILDISIPQNEVKETSKELAKV
jgi:hypothetical protein